MSDSIRAAVVGLRMGAYHARCYAELPAYELVGLCDVNEETLTSVGDELHCDARFTDYETMLREAKPELICIATSTHLHCPMTLSAVDAGVRSIYLEKPIAVNLKEARHMQAACEKAGVRLIVGHQRRMSSPYRRMREMIEGGVIGEVREMRASVPGDMLSDATHMIDSMLFLMGDSPVKWVLGQIYRGRKATAEELAANPFKYCGGRYGHTVEEGAMAALCFANGVRAELFTGTMTLPHHGYQDIEIIGEKGRIRRGGDGSIPPVVFETGCGWYDAEAADEDGMKTAHATVAEALRSGHKHPMEIDTAIRGFEIIMAILESARLRARLDMPLLQAEYPIDILLREGAME